MRLYVKKSRLFMCFFIFPVTDKNQCFRYISCGTLLLVHYFGLFMIRQFCELDLLKSTTQ